VVWCGVVWCGVVWCGVVWCGVVLCWVGLGWVVLCCVVLCCVVLYYVMLYYIILYYIILYITSYISYQIIKTLLDIYPAYTKFVEHNIGTGNLHITPMGSCKFSENKYSPSRTLLKGEIKIFPICSTFFSRFAKKKIYAGDFQKKI